MAITIELGSNGSLRLLIPGVRASGTYPIEVPCDEAGALFIRDLLRKRLADNNPTIGKQSSPTEQMVRQWLAHNAPTTERPLPKEQQELVNNLSEQVEIKL